MTPPFTPGDRALLRALPHHAVDVTACEPDDLGGFRVRYTHGDIEGSGAADRFLPAPADWIDAPRLPAGSAQIGGISHAGHVAKQAHDAADTAHQRAVADWHRDMIGWVERHMSRVPGVTAAVVAELCDGHRRKIEWHKPRSADAPALAAE